jgi:hypothetical protein
MTENESSFWDDLIDVFDGDDGFLNEPCDGCDANEICPLPILAQLGLTARFNGNMLQILEFLQNDKRELEDKGLPVPGITLHLIDWAKSLIAERIPVN